MTYNVGDKIGCKLCRDQKHALKKPDGQSCRLRNGTFEYGEIINVLPAADLPFTKYLVRHDSGFVEWISHMHAIAK